MATFRTRPLALSLLAVLALLTHYASAHGDHSHIPDDEAISTEPLDKILWTHILLQSLTWGILFPTGLVLGLVHNRWHVPVQSAASCLAILGYFLGHAHKGRQFARNAHAGFANWLMLMLVGQVVVGGYLRLHVFEKGVWGSRMRKGLVRGHKIMGALILVAAWVQMVLGGIATQGFCRGEHLGQCLAHFIMGSAFIAYGIVLTILLLCGQAWLARTGRSQEFWDSVIIALWGCVNTFTEHRWGGPWVHNDLQHTSMGIIWWAAGLVGIWLSRDRQGRPKRNLIPAIVIFMTGWAMSAHPQSLMLSTKVHSVFGYTLMSAGLTRLIEIAFILRDKVAPERPDDIDSEINSFQYLPPFLLYASGFLFMGATEEQMQVLSDAGVTHVSYILILYSISFLLFLFVLMLLHLYSSAVKPEAQKLHLAKPGDEEASQPLNPHSRVPDADERRTRDAQEFELEGLMSDEEDEIGKTRANGVSI